MEAVAYPAIVPVTDYLAGEEANEVCHGHLGGEVHAKPGGSMDHNLLAGNLYLAFRTHQRGKPCRAFMENVKVKLSLHTDDYFYHPDMMVGCDPRDTHGLYLRFPKLLVEVLSPNTERVNRREKFFAYTAALESWRNTSSSPSTAARSPSTAAPTAGGRKSSPAAAKSLSVRSNLPYRWMPSTKAWKA